jgi:hypothetical protein
MFRALEAALKSKVAVVAAVGAIAVGGGAGIAARSAGTSPQFGQQVKQQVASCKQELRPTTSGIGLCVSGLASQFGAQQRAAHAATAANAPAAGPGKASQARSRAALPPTASGQHPHGH